LTKKSIKGNIIQIQETEKTEEGVAIPILPELEKILKKYKDTERGFPQPISDGKLNEFIKDICRIVGKKADKSLSEIITHRKKLAGGEIELRTEPLYKFVSTHVGRRSFATNAITLGIPTEFVKKITGHKSDEAFWAYVKIKPTEYANLTANAYQQKAEQEAIRLKKLTEMEGVK